MKEAKTPLGYTIVEVMIVLAVSGLMLTMASTFINGKQARTAFTQGTNEMASRLQGLAGQVESGKFSDYPVTCTIRPSKIDIDPATSSNQGRNSDCVFLGKMFYFYEDGTTNAERYRVLTIADARVGFDGKIVNEFPSIYTDIASFLTTTESIPQGLFIESMRVTAAGGTVPGDFYSIGFVQGIGDIATDDTGNSTYKSGAQSINMVFASNNNIHQGNNADIPGNIRPKKIQMARKAEICISDGQRSSMLTIEPERTGSNVDVRYAENATCA